MANYQIANWNGGGCSSCGYGGSSFGGFGSCGGSNSCGSGGCPNCGNPHGIRSRLDFIKTNSCGKPIPGATFVLTGKGCIKALAYSTSDDKGRVSFRLESCRQYDVIELSAPNGFTVIPAPIEVTTDRCGGIFVNGRPYSRDMTVKNELRYPLTAKISIAQDGTISITGTAKPNSRVRGCFDLNTNNLKQIDSRLDFLCFEVCATIDTDASGSFSRVLETPGGVPTMYIAELLGITSITLYQLGDTQANLPCSGVPVDCPVTVQLPLPTLTSQGTTLEATAKTALVKHTKKAKKQQLQ